jgi:hypothetical protein
LRGSGCLARFPVGIILQKSGYPQMTQICADEIFRSEGMEYAQRILGV